MNDAAARLEQELGAAEALADELEKMLSPVLRPEVDASPKLAATAPDSDNAPLVVFIGSRAVALYAINGRLRALMRRIDL